MDREPSRTDRHSDCLSMPFIRDNPYREVIAMKEITKKKWTVYTIFHLRTETTVYVGCSSDCWKRWSQHRDRYYPGDKYVMYLGRVFSNKKEALQYEKNTIKKLKPTDNIRHNIQTSQDAI